MGGGFVRRGRTSTGRAACRPHNATLFNIPDLLAPESYCHQFYEQIKGLFVVIWEDRRPEILAAGKAGKEAEWPWSETTGAAGPRTAIFSLFGALKAFGRHRVIPRTLRHFSADPGEPQSPFGPKRHRSASREPLKQLSGNSLNWAFSPRIRFNPQRPQAFRHDWNRSLWSSAARYNPEHGPRFRHDAPKASSVARVPERNLF